MVREVARVNEFYVRAHAHVRTRERASIRLRLLRARKCQAFTTANRELTANREPQAPHQAKYLHTWVPKYDTLHNIIWCTYIGYA